MGDFTQQLVTQHKLFSGPVAFGVSSRTPTCFRALLLAFFLLANNQCKMQKDLQVSRAVRSREARQQLCLAKGPKGAKWPNYLLVSKLHPGSHHRSELHGKENWIPAISSLVLPITYRRIDWLHCIEKENSTSVCRFHYFCSLLQSYLKWKKT